MTSAVPHEARPYQGLRAGVVSRVLAASVDLVVVVVGLVALYGAYAVLRFLADPVNFRFPEVSTSAAITVGAFGMAAYLSVGWATTGRTFGAHLLGVRVVGRSGRRLGPARSLARASFCVLFPLGLFWSAVSRTNNSVQDAVLRTAVVYDWTEQPDPRELGGPSGQASSGQPV